MTRLVLFELFVTQLFEHKQKNCSLAEFSEIYDITKYGSG